MFRESMFLFAILFNFWTIKASVQSLSEQRRPASSLQWYFTDSAANSFQIAPHKRVKRLGVQLQETSLLDSNCKVVIKKVCPNLPENADDLNVLECMQSKVPSDPECQHVLYRRLMDFINNDHLKRAAESVCGPDLERLQCRNGEESGQLLTCVLEHLDEVNSQCQAYFQRVERVAFSDYRVFSKFMTDCDSDIKAKKCGRLQGDLSSSSQSGTLNCLQDFIDDLTESCKHEVLHLSVIQADNVRLDYNLNAACADDQRRFCPDVQPGSGKVYKCLMQYRLDRSMSEACQKQLGKYQKLIAHNYRISRGLVRACKNDIRQNHCRRAMPEDKDIRLAKILLCLEGLIRNGTKVSRDCEIEMMEHRKMLMEDYRLSPEIVSRCSEDITKFCYSLEVGGKTIHCLMEHARPKRKRERVSQQCQRALEVLMKDVDVGEDWRVDPVLREACKPVVDVACQDVRNGDARVINCLMDKLGTDHMTEACESALLQIQYFVARDFKLDPQLYRQCRDDAVHFCHAKRVWSDGSGQMDPERGPLVLPCLYRYAYHPAKERRLKKQCFEEVKRVMQQRALSVDLAPDVEQACMHDLSQFCVDKTQRGQETLCLQDKLDQLEPTCRVVIANLTEDQAAHVELNPVISSACKTVMQRHCENEWKSGRDEGNIMDCLVRHKNDVDVRDDYKCRAAIEHFQLISLKDYHFTFKFKEACRSSVIRFCRTSRTKYDVIACLSEVVRNDTMTDTRHSISKDCRKQLKSQLFHQRENINFDPKLMKACEAELNKFCSSVGPTKRLECLRMNKKDLSKECHKSIFRVEQELAYQGVDYTLMTTCSSMINMFCHEEVELHIFSCLKLHRNEPTFDIDCRKVVVHRMIEQNDDYRLNTQLNLACRPDIKSFCSDVLLQQTSDTELEGKVVACLKAQFSAGKLHEECQNQMVVLLRDAALNYQFNPLLSRMCENDIKRLCGAESDQETEGYGQGNVEECLKVSFRQGLVSEKPCRVEILALIDEGRADIHVDPLLHKACSIDLSKYCADTMQGSGRLIQCLAQHLSSTLGALHRDCHDKLSQRMELFSYTSKLSAKSVLAAPNTVNELYHHVKSFPAANYFMVVFVIAAGMLFLFGIFFGKITSRRIANKNK